MIYGVKDHFIQQFQELQLINNYFLLMLKKYKDMEIKFNLLFNQLIS